MRREMAGIYPASVHPADMDNGHACDHSVNVIRHGDIIAAVAKPPQLDVRFYRRTRRLGIRARLSDRTVPGNTALI